MKKSILWLIGLLFSFSLVVTSCEETDGAVDPYTDWKNRNQEYVDSISRVAYANRGEEVGQWKVIHSYKFNPPQGALEVDVNDYVYCKILEKGTGTLSPVFTDNVSVHYRGKLIPLYNGETFVFEQSYRGELDEEVNVPLVFGVGTVIPGWTTALQQMKVGDRWEIHIPQQLAYGTSGSNDIPAYSTLVFDIKLVDITTNR